MESCGCFLRKGAMLPREQSAQLGTAWLVPRVWFPSWVLDMVRYQLVIVSPLQSIQRSILKLPCS